MTDTKTKLVTLGDSIGTNYKLKVRSNTFSDLLGRRLGLEVCNYSTPAATVGQLLALLNTDKKMIKDVRDAMIVLIAAGSNNLLRAGINRIAAAAGIEQSMRMVNKIVDAIKKNPAVTLKMIGAMNSADIKEASRQSVADYKKDMDLLVERIHELNSEAIIMVPTLYTMTDVSRSLVYKAFSKPTIPYFNDINEWIRTKLPAKDVLVLELAEAFRNYDGDEELSNLKENDFHLSDFGHLFAYRQLYDRLIKDHPELSCEEGNDVIQERKARKVYKKEDGAYGRSKYSPIVREIVEKTSYEEIRDYDENKQFVQMGVSPTEVYDIGREIEKEVLHNEKEIPIPFSAYIRPTYFIDYLEGTLKKSLLERLDTLPHYASAEEKAEAEKDDSPIMAKIKEAVYYILGDEMVVLDKDTSVLGTMDADMLTWSRVMSRIQTLLSAPLDFAMTPDPENVTLKQIEEGIEKELR